MEFTHFSSISTLLTQHGFGGMCALKRGFPVTFDANLLKQLDPKRIVVGYLASGTIYAAIMLLLCPIPADWGATFGFPVLVPWLFLRRIIFRRDFQVSLFIGLITLVSALTSVGASLILRRRPSVVCGHVTLAAHWGWSIWFYCGMRGIGTGGFMNDGAW